MLREKVFNQIINDEQYNIQFSQMHKRVFVFTIKYRTIAISSKENILQKNLREKKTFL